MGVEIGSQEARDEDNYTMWPSPIEFDKVVTLAIEDGADTVNVCSRQ